MLGVEVPSTWSLSFCFQIMLTNYLCANSLHLSLHLPLSTLIATNNPSLKTDSKVKLYRALCFGSNEWHKGTQSSTLRACNARQSNRNKEREKKGEMEEGKRKDSMAKLQFDISKQFWISHQDKILKIIVLPRRILWVKIIFILTYIRGGTSIVIVLVPQIIKRTVTWVAMGRLGRSDVDHNKPWWPHCMQNTMAKWLSRNHPTSPPSAQGIRPSYLCLFHPNNKLSFPG